MVATLLYAALTVALTWPLARGLTRDVPADLGDPLFESWAIAWDATHLGRGLWNANIFYPHPLTLAYSEHLLPQAIQALPVYWATRNPILCYNLLFLSTFVLSGLGMFLFARELTGARAASVVAGLAFAFAPYRFGSLPHLQVLSSAWMPFALLGFRRYFVTRRPMYLVGAGSAWVVQSLSCLYYLLFFAPIVGLYVAWELTVRRLWTDRHALAALVVTGAAVAVAVAPFLLPYVELRRLGINPRSLEETSRYSADTYAYLTADPNLRLVGRLMHAWPKPEGLLFPGFTISALAMIAALSPVSPVSDTYMTRIKGGSVSDTYTRRVKVGAGAVATLLGLDLVMLIALLFGWTLRLPGLKITSLARVTVIGAALTVALLALSRPVRQKATRWLASPVGIFALLTLFAVLMSFGPHIHAKGRIIADPGAYAFFYDYVPGFDGVRVPARFAMIVALGLATLTAFGVVALERGGVRQIAAIAAALILVEALAVPLTINANSTSYKQAGLAPLPATLALDPNQRAAYDYVRALPPPAAVVELPLGEPAFDVRYMFFSTAHWKPIVNGYSGSEPDDYAFLSQALQDVASRPDRAWQALAGSHATHAIVHEAFYAGDGGARVSEWLRAHGAREVAAFGRDHIFHMP